MRKLILTACILGIALAACGGGSSGKSSQQQTVAAFAARADPICRTLNVQAVEIFNYAVPHASDNPPIAVAAQRYAEALARLERMTPPKSVAAAWSAVVQRDKQLAVLAQELVAAPQPLPPSHPSSSQLAHAAEQAQATIPSIPRRPAHTKLPGLPDCGPS